MADNKPTKELLADFLKDYENGLLEQIMSSKQLDFPKSIFLNDRLILSIILLPKKELEKLKDLPSEDVRSILFRHILLTSAKTTEELADRYHKTYQHKFLYISGTSKATECQIADDSTGVIIKKFEGKTTGLANVSSFFIASKIIPASAWLDSVPTSAGGKISNANVADDAVMPTRIKFRSNLIKSTKD
mgnify:FL=1